MEIWIKYKKTNYLLLYYHTLSILLYQRLKKEYTMSRINNILAGVAVLLLSCKEQSTDPESSTGTVTDTDRNVYKTLKIGNQWWMAENLKVTHYANGDSIPFIKFGRDWGNITSGAYCFFMNDSVNATIYGNLYNRFAADDQRSIAPEGWHVSSDEEWLTLINF